MARKSSSEGTFSTKQLLATIVACGMLRDNKGDHIPLSYLLIRVQYRLSKLSAIWSGNFLAFYYKSGGHLVRQWQLCNFVLFCLGTSVVYTTPLNPTTVLFIDPVNTNTELDLLIRILSPLSGILLWLTCYSYSYNIYTKLLNLVTKYNCFIDLLIKRN